MNTNPDQFSALANYANTPDSSTDNNQFSALANYSGSQPVKPTTSLGSRLKDVGITALKSAIGVPEEFLGLADIPTSGYAGKLAEQAGFRPKEAKQILESNYSPEQQQAEQNVRQAQGFIPTIKAYGENPSAFLHDTGEQVFPMLGGAPISRGIMKIAPKVAPYLAGAASEGLLTAGQNLEQVRQEEPSGVLNPLKQTLPIVASAALTGAIAAGSGKIANKLGLTDIESLIAGGKTPTIGTRGAVKNILGTTALEGLGQEMPQSYTEQVAQNYAQGKPLTEGAGQAAAQGLLMGSALGGGGAMIDPSTYQRPTGPLSKALGTVPPIPPTQLTQPGVPNAETSQVQPTGTNAGTGTGQDTGNVSANGIPATETPGAGGTDRSAELDNLRTQREAERVSTAGGANATDGSIKAVNPPTPPFLQPDELRRQDLMARAKAAGVDSDVMDKIVPKETLDSVTGFYPASDKVPTVRRALKHVEDTGDTAYYVEADIANLGGLNSHFKNNSEKANPVYRAISDIFADEMNQAGHTAVNIRHGGDEFGSVVIGATPESIKQAKINANQRIENLMAEQGLNAIPHPKSKPGSLKPAGIHLYMGHSEIMPGRSLNDIFTDSSAELDRGKIGVSNVGQEKTETTGNGEPVTGGTNQTAQPTLATIGSGDRTATSGAEATPDQTGKPELTNPPPTGEENAQTKAQTSTQENPVQTTAPIQEGGKSSLLGEGINESSLKNQPLPVPAGSEETIAQQGNAAPETPAVQGVVQATATKLGAKGKASEQVTNAYNARKEKLEQLKTAKQVITPGTDTYLKDKGFTPDEITEIQTKQSEGKEIKGWARGRFGFDRIRDVDFTKAAKPTDKKNLTVQSTNDQSKKAVISQINEKRARLLREKYTKRYPSDAEYVEKIVASKLSGNKHLDDFKNEVEYTRGKQVRYIGDNRETGTVVTRKNQGNTLIKWNDEYSAKKNQAEPKKNKNGKIIGYEPTWLHNAEGNQYIVSDKKQSEQETKAVQPTDKENLTVQPQPPAAKPEAPKAKDFKTAGEYHAAKLQYVNANKPEAKPTEKLTGPERIRARTAEREKERKLNEKNSEPIVRKSNEQILKENNDRKYGDLSIERLKEISKEIDMEIQKHHKASLGQMQNGHRITAKATHEQAVSNLLSEQLKLNSYIEGKIQAKPTPEATEKTKTTDQGTSLYSKATPTTGSTVEKVTGWIGAQKRLGDLLKSGKLQVRRNINELSADELRGGDVLFHAAWHGGPHEKANQGAEGLYNPRIDKMFIFADNITKESLPIILAHENFHRAKAIDPKVQAILKQFDSDMQRQFDLNAKGNGTKAELEAYKRVINAGTPTINQLEEYQAYLTKQLAQNPNSLTGKIKQIIQRFFAQIRMALLKHGLDFGMVKKLSPADLWAISGAGTRVMDKAQSYNGEPNQREKLGSSEASSPSPVLYSIRSDLNHAATNISNQEDIKNVTTGVSQAIDGLAMAVAPQYRSDAAREVSRQIIEGMGKKELESIHFKSALNKAIVEHNDNLTLAQKARSLIEKGLTVAADKVFLKMTPEESQAFMQAMDTGDKQYFKDNPDLQGMADIIDKMFQDKAKNVQALDTGALQNLRENYFPHIWEKEPEGDKLKQIYSELAKRPFEGSKSFTKQRVFDDVNAGLVLGYKPITNNPLDMVLLKMNEMDKYILAHGTLKAMAEHSDAVLLNPAGDKVPQGYTDINGRYGFIKRDGQSLRYVGREDVAQVINNYLSPSLYNNKYVGNIFKGYMGAANTLNQFQLGVFSAFHAGFTSMEAVISHASIGLKALSNGDFKGAAKYLGEAPAAWINNPKMGNRIVEAMMDSGSHPEMADIVEGLQMAGFKYQMDTRFRTDSTNKMLANWAEGKKVRAGLHSINAVVEQSARPILEWLVPRQKFGVFGEMYNKWMHDNPNATHEELRDSAQQIWNRVDSRLGQVVYDRLFTHNVAKNFVQMLLRAPGWTGGTILEVGGGMKDLASYARNPSKGLTDRAAYTLSLVTISAITNAVLTAMFTGEPPDKWQDLVAFKTGNIDEKGNPERFTLPTYLKDIYGYAEQGIPTTLEHKTHPLLNLIGNIVTNRDYYGTEVRSPDSDIFTQLAQTAGFVAKTFTPFWMQGVAKEQERKGSLLSQALPLIGVMPSPSSLNQTKAQKLAQEYGAERMPQGSRTKEETEKMDMRRKIYVALRKGDRAEALKLFGEGRQLGLMPQDFKRIQAKARSEPLVNSFKSLTYDQAAKVYDVATDEEKAKLEPLWRKKRMMNSRLERYKESGAVAY